MAEIIEPGTLKTPTRQRNLRVHISDIVIFGIIILVIVALTATLLNKLSVKHDVANAKVVADQLVTDIAKRDGASARKLGDTTFQSKNSAAALTAQFKAIEPVTSHSRSVDHQTLSRGKSGKTVFIVYKYPTKDLAFYIQVAVTQNSKTKHWELANITGNADESTLVTN